MATFKSFEEIVAWQKARELNIEVYAGLKDCRDLGFKDQLQRASVSIMNNIAEGFERYGGKEFRHFLYIAKGSAGEVRSMLSLAGPLGYFSDEQVHRLNEQATAISAMLAKLIKTLDRK